MQRAGIVLISASVVLGLAEISLDLSGYPVSYVIPALAVTGLALYLMGRRRAQKAEEKTS